MVTLMDELKHHGIMGQKWGVRRFQFKDGSLTDEGRQRYGSIKENISKWKIRVKNKKDEMSEKKEARKAKQQENEEKRKKELVEYGTPEEIKKNIGMFNTSELKDINNRFNEQKKVYEAVDAISKSKKAETAPANKKDVFKMYNKSTESAFSAIEKTLKATENAKKLYNTVASVYNYGATGNILNGNQVRYIR